MEKSKKKNVLAETLSPLVSEIKEKQKQLSTDVYSLADFVQVDKIRKHIKTLS